MVSVRRCHTAELTATDLAQARSLCDTSFDDFSDTDWDNALGGTHVLVHDDGVLVGHGSLVMRRLLADRTRSLRCGYVEAVAVHPEHRRRGHGDQVMAGLEGLAAAYDLLALSASDVGATMYERRGWTPWRGTSFVVATTGLVRTPEDDDGIYVLGADLGAVAELACDWRPGDVW